MVQHDSTILHCLFVCTMTSNHIGLKSENTMEWHPRHPNIACSFYVQLMNYDNLPGQFQGTWSVEKVEATKIGGMSLGTVATMGRMTGGTFWAEDIGNPAENCWIHVATRDFSDPKPWYGQDVSITSTAFLDRRSHGASTLQCFALVIKCKKEITRLLWKILGNVKIEGLTITYYNPFRS